MKKSWSVPYFTCVFVMIAMNMPANAAIAFRAAAQGSVLTQVGVVPAFIASTTGTTGASGASSVTVTRPGTAVVNRVLVGQITLKGIVATITAPAGWNLVDLRSTSTAGAEVTQAVYWRVETAGEAASYTWSWTGTVRGSGGLTSFDNVETRYPFDVWGVQTTNNNATITLPNLTTTSMNTMLVALLSSSYSSSHATPTGMNEYYDVATGAGPNGVTASAATLVQTNPGATGAKTSTVATSAADNIAHLFALRAKGALTINVPTGTALNDVMIASVVYRPCSNLSGGACTTTITPPAGWTLVRNVDTNNGGGTDGYGSRLFVYQRVATATEPASYTWYFGGTPVQAGAAGGILSFSGVDTANPVVAESGQVTASSRNHTAPSIDTGAVTNTMLVSSHSLNSSGTWTPPGGMTEAVDISSRTPTNDLGVSLEINYQAQATAGATGTRTATLSNPPAADTGGTHMLALRPASTGFDHIRFEHDGAGVTCAAEPVTVKACADAACSTLSTGSATVTLSGTGWASNPVTFTGSTTVNLSKTSPQTVTLATTVVAPVPPNGVDCFNGTTTNNSTACQLPFADTGFIFSSIPTQVAGVTSGNITLQAVRKSDSSAACVGLFSGNVAIDLASQCVDPTTCAGKQITINSTAITNSPASGIAGYTPVTLNFGANSIATFTLSYPDVGMMSLHARYLLAGTDYMTGSSNAFVVKPDHFVLSAIQQTAAPNTANPAAVDATGGRFVKAGEAFSVTVTAMTAGGTATPNYGKEVTPEGVNLTSALVGGLGLTDNPALSNSTAFGAFSIGTATGTTFSWAEVGIITLTPSVGDGSYLGVGDVTGTVSGNVGRFYPDHFDTVVTQVAGVPMGCPTPLIFPCPVPYNGMVYSGQPFRLTVTAKNGLALPSTTVNYNYSATPANSFSRAVTLGAWDALGSTTTSNPGSGNLTNNTIRAARFSAGISTDTLTGTVGVTSGSAIVTGTGTSFLTQLAVGDFINIVGADYKVSAIASDTSLTLTASYVAATAASITAYAKPAYTFTVVPTNQTNIYIRATDGEASSLRNPTTTSVEGGVQVVSGRIMIPNAYGSELLKLPIGVTVQYWNGTRWVTSTTDSVTRFNTNKTTAGGNMAATIAKGPLTVADVNALSPGLTTFLNGAMTVTLDKPGANKNGSADLTINAPSYLPSTKGRATFGIYKNRFIYLREMY